MLSRLSDLDALFEKNRFPSSLGRSRWLLLSLGLHAVALSLMFWSPPCPPSAREEKRPVPVWIVPSEEDSAGGPTRPTGPDSASSTPLPPIPTVEEHTLPPQEQVLRPVPTRPSVPARLPEEPLGKPPAVASDTARGAVPSLQGHERDDRGGVELDEEGLTPRSEVTPPALIDREIVARAGRAGTPQTPELTFRTGGLKYTTYLYRLKDQIEYVWKYPTREGQLGIEGDLYIRFAIGKDGSLAALDLVRTSGYPALDQAAMQAVKDAAPFYPLPKTWEMDTFSITGHFIYHSGRSYLR